MKIVQSIQAAQQFPKLCVALGNFDGVHLGHQKLIKTAVDEARKIQGTPAVLTFSPHPAKVIRPEQASKSLITHERKIKLLAELGINLVLQLPFTREFASIPAEEFVQTLVEKLDLSLLVVGFNYSFGKGGTGDWKLLNNLSSSFHFSLKVIPPVKVDQLVVSSTAVRTALAHGQVSLATQLLGRPPLLEGKIVPGNQLGRTLGFPTANIDVDGEILLPQAGVYLSKVLISRQPYFGLLNIGFRPTLTRTPEPVAEVHILDFNRELYGEYLEVFLLEKLRPEKKFASKEQLIAQIHADLDTAIKIIKNKYQ